MNKAQEREELTAIITCQQKLEIMHTMLAKGVNRTKDQRFDLWCQIKMLANKCVAQITLENAEPNTANEQPAEQPK